LKGFSTLHRPDVRKSSAFPRANRIDPNGDAAIPPGRRSRENLFNPKSKIPNPKSNSPAFPLFE
jgi:hypothetical protein